MIISKLNLNKLKHKRLNCKKKSIKYKLIVNKLNNKIRSETLSSNQFETLSHLNLAKEYSRNNAVSLSWDGHFNFLYFTFAAFGHLHMQ